MRTALRWGLGLVWLVCAGMTTALAAENDGQEALDRAVEAKLGAESFRELGEVISLCREALDQGLDEQNTEFCQQLLSSTLIERATLLAETIFGTGGPDPQWVRIRELALDDLEAAAELSPDSFEVQFLIGKLHSLPGGDAQAAHAALDQAIELGADNEELDPSSLAEAYLYRSALHDDIEERLADLTRAAELAPSDPKPVRARAALLYAQGKQEEAIAAFDAALQIDPTDAATHEAKGTILLELGRTEEAIESFGHALECDPKASDALTQRSRAHLMLDQLDEAISDSTAALEINPDDPLARLVRSQATAQQGDFEGALDDVNRVLREFPDLEPAIRLRAAILAGTGDFDAAIEDLEDLEAEHPEDVETLLQLAIFYHSSGRSHDAIEVYTRVIELDPQNVPALRGRADAYLAIGEHTPAIADYDAVLEIEPENSGVLNNLAWTLATSPIDELRDGQRALELATRACEVTDFKEAHILSTLAAAYAELGDFETAKKWSSQAVEMGSEEMRENLQRELDSYEAGEPWREVMPPAETADDGDEPDDEEEEDDERPRGRDQIRA